jgi:hypothetical protein
MATIQEIIKKHYSTFERRHRLQDYVRKAAEALMKCRTSELGGHVQACPEGHYHRQWYNSCRNRVCPQCNWLQIEQWLQRQSERLLKCGHYHMIFTIPHELNVLWLWNKKAITNILFKAVRDTLFEFFLDKKHIGGKPGIMATQHTWSQTLIDHPHIHSLVTEGGKTEDGHWIARNNGYLLPVRAVMAVFRGKMLDNVDKAIEKRKIRIPETMSIQQWKNLKNKLGRKKWNVHIRQRYEYGNGVLTYLSRYIRGGAISNRRIQSLKNGIITFTRRNTENRRVMMELPADEFLRRYFMHVPEPYTKVVRYYGLYAPTGKDELSDCRRQLSQQPVKEAEEIGWQEYCERQGEDHPELCPVCGSKLVRLADILRPNPAKPPDGERLRPAA